MPFWAARIISGSAARKAAAASVWLPEASASSTFRTKVRTRLRRDLLIAVRFAILRVIFLADTVLAMGLSSFLKADAQNQALYGLGGDRVIAWKPESPLRERAHVERLIDGSVRNVNAGERPAFKKGPQATAATGWPGRG